MPVIRILSYNLHGCRDMAALYRTIDAAAATFVTLQNVDSLPPGQSVASVASETGYSFTDVGGNGSLAILARQPIKFIQTYDLGAGAYCMKLDLYHKDRRFIVLNVGLSGSFLKRPAQIRSLLGPNLLDQSALSLPTVVLGDFYDIVWASGNYNFNKQLQRYAPPLLRATYPAVMPIFSRDRVYAMGGIQISNVVINHNKDARRATYHLPIIFDVKITDTRIAMPAHSQTQRIEVVAN